LKAGLLPREERKLEEPVPPALLPAAADGFEEMDYFTPAATPFTHGRERLEPAEFLGF
jgi:hypothetical protein